MSRSTQGILRVVPTAATRLEGDEPLDIDPASTSAAVEPWGPGRAVVHGDRDAWALVDEDRLPATRGPRTVEVVVDGWRFELEVESARLSDLRARATKTRSLAVGSGPIEIRAMIPGRVVDVAVAAGDEVTAGQTILVIEAMKMQNELRAPNAGRIERLAVGAGETIDLGQVLAILALHG